MSLTTTDNTTIPLPPPFSLIPRIPLTYPHPTPIEPLHRLTTHLTTKHVTNSSSSLPTSTSSSNKSPNISLYIKRDDTNSGLSGGGGNKLRKLEYVIADAVAAGADTLVTEGGIQSNHMRQCVGAGARVGMRTVLLPKTLVPNTNPQYLESANVQLTHLMSATHLPPNTPPESQIQHLRQQGHQPYFIPSGASLHPLGGLGYARCAFEIAQQEKALGSTFDVIVVPTMSGSTLGGLVAGFAAVDQMGGRGERKRGRRIVGVLAAPKVREEFIALVLGIAKTAAELIGVDPCMISEDQFEIDDRWSAGEYGLLDQRTKDGIKLLASVEGVITDPVYSGKAFTGMLGMVKNGEVEDGESVLFLHTGGVASVGAYEELR